MRVAVIGGGISGLSSAWFLAKDHSVTLFEKDALLGGHAHTAEVVFGKEKIPVDTAFIVFNEQNYPNLTAFFKTLGVVTDPVEMIMAISLDEGRFEWSTKKYSGVFADRKNMVRPGFWKMVNEINRFNAIARRELALGSVDDETLHEFLDRHAFSADFRANYLFPVTSAIWSVSSEGIGASPAKSVLGFLDNHRVLSMSENERIGWRTVHRGSRHYVDAVAADLAGHGGIIRLNTSIKKVRRGKQAVTITTDAGSDTFDYVILATHADTTLSLLDDATTLERKLLSPFAYERNDVYLHSDDSFMPKRKRAWGTWAYLGESASADGTQRAQITYYMNALQEIDARYPLFVTLNPSRKPDPQKTHGRYIYHHPVYSPAAIRAQKRLQELQAGNRTLFCGSYFGFGFHEDGITSAIEAVRHLGVVPPWA